MHKSAKNKGVTASQSDSNSAPNKPSKVSSADKTDTANVTNSDKLNDKPDDKLTADADLAFVLEAWPELPEAIQSAIVALVRASDSKNRG